MSLRERSKNRRRKRILDAAIAILEESGPSGLSTAAIADKAEVSIPTLYNLIGSIDSILGQVLDSILLDFAESIEIGEGRALEKADSLMDQIGSYLTANDLRNRQVLALVIQQHISSMRPPSPAAMLANSLDWFVQLVVDAQREGDVMPEADPVELAETLMLGTGITVQNWVLESTSSKALNPKIRFHVYSLLSAWATPQSIDTIKTRLMRAQSELTQLGHSAAPVSPAAIA